jgi:hypothetical protein
MASSSRSSARPSNQVLVLEAGDFYEPKHAEIFRTLTGLYDRNQPVDLVLATNELNGAGRLEALGGVDFLVGLMESVPTAAHAQQFRNPVHCSDLSVDNLVYVCDRPNDRLQVFTREGKFVDETYRHEDAGDGSVWMCLLEGSGTGIIHRRRQERAHHVLLRDARC